MKKLILSLGILGALLAFSTADAAPKDLPACSDIDAQDRDIKGGDATCKCTYPTDCTVPLCTFKLGRKCEVSPSASWQNFEWDPLANKFTFNQSR
jgi:hypothetical protein